MAAVPAMPLRGERSAPTFNETEPNDLIRYFKQLETLFTRSTIQPDADKKEYATSYVKAEVAESWEAIPEFADAAKTYAQFRDRLKELYNQTALRYILSDLDRLIGERQRLGMRSLQDLSDFHFRFNVISSFLIANQLLSSREQSQAYLRVFDDALQNRITMRLQIILANHHPSLPYEITEVYDAAKWVLQGTSGAMGLPLAAPSPFSTSTATASKSTPDQGYVKTEQLGSFLTEFAKTIVDTLNANRTRPSPSGGGPMTRGNKCMFDGCDAFIRDCPAVEDYIKQGKCRRNHEGKVILSSGAFVPRDIQGEFLKDRIDEWHRRNPNQLASGQLSGNTSLLGAIVSTSPQATTSLPVASGYPILQLSTQERIVALEAEIFALRARQPPSFVPTIKTRTQRAAQREAEKGKEETRQKTPPVEEPTRISEIIEPHRSPSHDHAPTATNVADDSPSRVPVPAMPEHPFRNAKDATYAPPQKRAVSLPVRPVAKKVDAAYRTLPAIHDAAIATTVYNRALDTPLSITYHELLSLSPEVRSQVRDAVSSKRVPNKDVATPVTTEVNLLRDDQPTEEELAYLFPDEELVAYDDEFEPYSEVTMTLAGSVKTDLPDDAIVVDDPVDRYYRTLPKGEKPNLDALIVAKESMALRAIVPLVNNHLKVESIIDPGCQIIAMSEECCHALALPYDPTIVVNMQSANGIVDPSLGLARNVPFLVGSFTFYMQVHVIRSPAYDILLGRPFDVLTESVVRNYRNEDQTITIHDPNSSRVATIPTISRGPPRILSRKSVVFHQ